MGLSVLDEAVELARSGGQAGEFVAGKHAERHAEKANDDRDAKNAARGEKNLEFAVILRPDISMQQITGVPYVAAYGLVKNLKGSISNIGIAWPYGIVVKDAPFGVVQTRAGYADGMFVVCGISFDLRCLDAKGLSEAETLLAAKVLEPAALAKAIVSAVDVWASDSRAGRAAAGPLAPILSDYFDVIPLIGHKVDVVYSNGNVAYTARFGGVDVWGRAILVGADDKETVITPEQASIRASR